MPIAHANYSVRVCVCVREGVGARFGHAEG